MIPHFFRKQPIPEITNQDLLWAIAEVRAQENQEKAIKRSLTLLANKFCGYKFKTYVYLSSIIEKDPNALWDREQDFMHCHHQNLLLRIMLVKSGWFTDEDIRHGYSLVWLISPHQWLAVKMGESEVALDPWNQSLGAKWNEYLDEFGFASL